MVFTTFKFSPSVAVAVLAMTAITAVTPSPVAAQCSTGPYASCGSDASGVTCCPSNYYCQPWDAGFYQCMPQPSQCSQQLTNVDLAGDDLKTVYGIQPSECCSQCAQTPGCKAYTFVNSNPGQPACYLKSAVGERRTKVGAVSGVVNGGAPTSPPVTPPTTTTPTPVTTTPTPTVTPSSAPPTSCPTTPYGSCGDSNATTCCPSGFFCQPWNPTYYQCIATPPRCAAQYTDTDFYGNDIKMVSVSLPSLCCDACANTPGCKAYTYINNNPGQPACYLKSAAGVASSRVGAVSAKLTS